MSLARKTFDDGTELAATDQLLVEYLFAKKKNHSEQIEVDIRADFIEMSCRQSTDHSHHM